ncbi:MAG: cell division protein FtsZ [Elusimicrobiota bacterium]|jgi:cell division protein FtsZ|nr:cell division protein FtsZ [Elusimicrobiota bacterium]
MTDTKNTGMDSLFAQAEQFEGKKAKIKCVGVGGGGGNAINHMMEAGVADVDFIAINTDAQDLRRNKAPYLVQVGEKITKGLGVGGDPERGKKAAEESLEQLRLIVADTDLLFITAGMGGGTGTGVAPQLARVAKETYGENILVVGVVTRPFNFEGFIRADQADKGIQEMQKYTDSMIIVPNERLFENVDARTTTKTAFKMVDEVLLQAVKGISEVILKPGEMNIDYNDLKKIMLCSGRSLIGIGQAKGNKRHLTAARDALNSPLLENADITGAKGFIVFFTASDEINLLEQGEVMNIIRQYASNGSIIKFGHMYDNTLEEGSLRVTVIATGFAKEGIPKFPSLRVAHRPSATMQHGPMPSAPQQGGQLDAESDFLLIPAYIRRKKEVK